MQELFLHRVRELRSDLVIKEVTTPIMMVGYRDNDWHLINHIHMDPADQMTEMAKYMHVDHVHVRTLTPLGFIEQNSKDYTYAPKFFVGSAENHDDVFELWINKFIAVTRSVTTVFMYKYPALHFSEINVIENHVVETAKMTVGTHDKMFALNDLLTIKTFSVLGRFAIPSATPVGC